MRRSDSMLESNQTEDLNAAAVRRFFDEVLDGGRLELIDRLAKPESVLHAPLGGLEPGPEGLKKFVTSLREGFPNFNAKIDDLITSGDKVIVRWRSAQQTHLGPYRGIPPTGREIHMTGIEIFRMENGQIAECWIELDQLGAVRQMGVIPPEDASSGRRVLFILGSLFRMGLLEAKHNVRRALSKRGRARPG